MIVPLWCRTDRLPAGRLESALAALPMARPGGPLDAFSTMVRGRAFRRYTITLSLIRVGAP